VAAAFLKRQGVKVMRRNVAVGRGEIDLMAVDGGSRVVVEVRTITGRHDPILAFDEGKANQVSGLAAKVGADRIDLVAIRLGLDGAELRWIRGVA